MTPRHSPELVERTRVLIETTTRPVRDIGAEVGVCVTTVRDWMKRYGWRRPPGAEREIKLPASKAAPARRLHELGAAAEDLAALIGCVPSYVNQYARTNGWTRRPQPVASAPPISAELAAVEAALREPDLTRRDLIRWIERGLALSAADVLATGAAAAERRSATLARLAATARGMPADPAPACQCGGDPDHFPDANEIIDDIVRRFEEFAAMEDQGLFCFQPPGERSAPERGADARMRGDCASPPCAPI